MLNPGDKKAIAILVLVAVVFVAVVGGTVATLVATGNSHREKGYAQLAVGDRLHRIEPAMWCTVYGGDCVTDPGIHRVPVPPGTSVVLSVSREIAEGPWGLVTQYAHADGTVIDDNPQPHLQLSGETYTVVLPSRPDQVLVNIEIQPLSVSVQGDEIALRGLLAVDTTPVGMTLRAGTPAR
ncbi:MAG: DUF2771 family protein [Gordonia sp. (in: high G+C Gram-positive bacteria)]